jgi:DNA-binding transcriptional LysR family regulator
MTDLRQLRYFVAVARRLHFTRAAEDLMIAQPAVSQSIRRLEKELAVTLFDRTSRGVALTQAGEVLLRGADRTLRELEIALAEVSSYAGMVSGRVRIGARQSMVVHLPELLAAFSHAHPAVDVSIIEVVSDAMLEDVRAGSLDLAFVVHRDHVNMNGLNAEPFLSEPYQLAVNLGDRLAGRKSVRLEDLAQERFIMHWPGSAVREVTLAACAIAGYRPRIAVETDSNNAARAYVSAGLGVAVMPRSCLHVPGPDIHRLDLRPMLTRTSALVWSSNGHASSAARAFIDFTLKNKNLLA